MDVHEQVDMVGLATELQQLAVPSLQDLVERATQVLQQLRLEALSPILGHQNNMQPKQKNCVRA